MLINNSALTLQILNLRPSKFFLFLNKKISFKIIVHALLSTFYRIRKNILNISENSLISSFSRFQWTRPSLNLHVTHNSVYMKLYLLMRITLTFKLKCAMFICYNVTRSIRNELFYYEPTYLVVPALS